MKPIYTTVLLLTIGTLIFLLTRPAPDEPETSLPKVENQTIISKRKINPADDGKVRLPLAELKKSGHFDPTRRYRTRMIPFSALPRDIVTEIRRTMIPASFSIPPALMKKGPIKSKDEAQSYLTNFVSPMLTRLYPHSGCDGEEYFLLWGGHTIRPWRGFAVRKSDSAIMAWALNDNHIWSDGNDPAARMLATSIGWVDDGKKRMTSDGRLVQGYFIPEEIWRKKQAKWEEEAPARAAAEKARAKRDRQHYQQVREAEIAAAEQARNEDQNTQQNGKTEQ